MWEWLHLGIMHQTFGSIVLTKVISGGQIGVDLAALKAAKYMGIETGGTCERHYSTLDGADWGEAIAKEYGLVPARAGGYPARTEANVRSSDCTVRLAINFRTYGEQCTLKYIQKHSKPYVDIQINKTGDYQYDFPHHRALSHWLIQGRYNVVNFAGNAQSQLEWHVEQYLQRVFFDVLDYRFASTPDWTI